jgi:hypothetical protein
MKRIFQYTAIVIALSLAASCNLIEEKTVESGLISFEPQSVKTKALFNNATDLRAEKFAIWDYWSGATEAYINNSIAYSSNKWNYVTDATYYWKDGSHKFISYTIDNNDNSFEFDKCSFSALTWNVGSTATPITITTTSNQKDLLYADTTVTASDWKTTTGHTKDTPVPLTFHHLLSAIRITMVNGSGEQVTVTNASVTLLNTGSASVSFSGTTTPSSSVTATPAEFCSFTTQTLSAGDSLDVLTGGAKLSDRATPYVIWPQTLAADAAKIKFSLAYGENAASDTTVSIPAGTWKAGEINNYKLLIYPNDVKLIFEVQPWEKVEIPNIDTSNGSINMSNVAWMNSVVRVGDQDKNTVDNGAYSVYMYYLPNVTGSYNGYYPAQGYFTVNYPLKGKFKIGLIPAYGETTVDATKYEIWVYDDANKAFRQMKGENQGYEDLDDWRQYDEDSGELKGANTIYFQVRAAAGHSATQQSKAQIDIWFDPEEPGGDAQQVHEWISAYSEIRANYALVIPKQTNVIE